MTSDERIRLGMLVPHRGMSGAEVNVASLLQHLPRDRFRIHLFAPEGQQLLEVAHAEGHSVHQATFPRFYSTSVEIGQRRVMNPAAVLYDLFAAQRLAARTAQFVRQQRIQVLYSSSMMGHLVAALINWPRKQVGTVIHLQEVISSRLAGGLGRRFFNGVTHSANQILVVSQAVARPLQPGLPVRRLHNGVDLARFEGADPKKLRAELGLPPETVLIGVVGRLAPWKGHMVFLDAAARLVNRDLPCHFVIVGDSVDPVTGATPYRATLESQRDRLGLQRHVSFLGHRKDVPDMMRGLDILVVPSVRPDPLPLVAIEGMGSGKPVVATNHGGLPEMVIDHQTGRLVPPNDSEALSEALHELITNPQLRARYGQAGIERVRNHFTLDRFIAEMADVFTQAANEQATGGVRHHEHETHPVRL